MTTTGGAYYDFLFFGSTCFSFKVGVTFWGKIRMFLKENDTNKTKTPEGHDRDLANFLVRLRKGAKSHGKACLVTIGTARLE